ncbi:YhbY family RNA-binding protein [Haloquadratum walsbyi]|jgi:RNA-binding protein|uniref:CRM domain protein n=2 Tax=Haloquadratum walsbyi TaxID=293091 RepID=Q18HC8_HALWD|nr:YhbY family RNA-binding protein [Haloquadratum walsbyi]CAJ52614.1 CRM domain protein [Haloquadratum walsbyi DSM 16790]CCC40617.1 CRM domain protein [Haloquadratum walsbyi C23]
MDTQALRKQAHDLDITVWVGKSGIDPVEPELDNQLKDTDLVKVKFLRAAQGGTTVAELADDLANRVNAHVIETRGNTGVLYRR